jgi:8-oxo-dGTP pyrophosphatase MutT (NUDIX family)
MAETEIVAGVCYRDRNGDVEFLLVRTKGGRRWTFPKGHVKRAEQAEPWRAAAREAREEAGVEGDVEHEPLAYYRYPATRPDERESLVAAYLLRVRTQAAPAADEAVREPTWFGPDEAIQKLAEGGREPEYAEEHAGVIRVALDAIAAPRA